MNNEPQPIINNAPEGTDGGNGQKRPGVLWAAGLLAGVALIGVAVWAILFRQSPGTDMTTTAVLPTPQEEGVIIGFSVADFRESRWRAERDLIESGARELGATVITTTADGDADMQEAQVKNLILQGAKVIIIVAQDGEKAASIVEYAHEKGVKVIAYDRLIKNADLDYYVTFDNVKVGEYQAQGVLDAMGGKGKIAYIGGSPTDNNAFLVREGSFNVLQPKIDSGDVIIVLDTLTDDWDAKLAYSSLNDFLNDGGKVDGVVVANDGMASGVIQALEEHGLANKVPVSGQDAELRACRDIVSGLQTVTVYKPLRHLAAEALNMALAAAEGPLVETGTTVNNGKIDVPARLLDVVSVTKDNIDATVVADGLYSHEAIFETIP